VSGYPDVPTIEGADGLEGDAVAIPANFPVLKTIAGKKAVVLGSNNSAHDICAALWEEDVDVTMIQRSSTHIAPSESLMELAFGRLFTPSEALKSEP
jgi:putative flavoprotein involved in K+ transport